MSDVVAKREDQEHFDRALDCREKSRHALADSPNSAVAPKLGTAYRHHAEVVDREYGPPDSAVAFGRIDLEKESEPFYIGERAIHDEEMDVLVVNWRMDLAQPYFQATIGDPQGLVRKRTFTTEGNTIVQFEDIVFADLEQDVEALEAWRSDALLEELDRHRTGEMHEIVRTIQASQDKLIRSDPDQLLVIQGGPGTGKTAVGLHRLSYLLYETRERPLVSEDVLVVGPNRTFIRYVRSVLPSLGDRNVEQVEIQRLAPEVRLGIEDSAELRRLKGELRMADLLRQGLADRVFPPADGVTIAAGGARTVRLSPEDITRLIDSTSATSYTAGRQTLRQALVRRVRQVADAGPDQATMASIDNALERIWPQLTAPAFLQDLLGSRDRLLLAAGSSFTASEVQMLYRRSADRISEQEWSAVDLPLLDEAESLISIETTKRFQHLVIDEAQDLSPMQLRSLARRSRDGSMTVLGDLAQSTGPFARSSWDEVIEILRGSVPAGIEELDVGYRVPRQVYEFAAALLPTIAPELSEPKVVRDGPADPLLVEVTADDLADQAVEQARELLSRGLSVAVISLPDRLDEVADAFVAAGVAHGRDDREGLGGPITLVAAERVKGLEFDAVVVVDPEGFASSGVEGLRLLYIALTRPTQRLTVVHTGDPLPVASAIESDGLLSDHDDGEPEPAGGGSVEPVPDQPVRSKAVTALAGSLADQVAELVAHDRWDTVLEAVREELERRRLDENHGEQ